MAATCRKGQTDRRLVTFNTRFLISWTTRLGKSGTMPRINSVDESIVLD